MNNDLFYVIAAGPSYLDVTQDEWKYLEDKHTLCFARVPYGSNKTEYYMSFEKISLDRSVIGYMAKLGWNDVKLLLSIPESIRYARKLKFKNIQTIIKQNFYFLPSRQPWFCDQEKPPHSFLTSRAKTFDSPLFRYRGQLSAAINCCLILGAKEIRLIGVDLNDQDNFYDDFTVLRKLCKDEETINEYIEHKNSKQTSDRMKSKLELNPEFNPETMHTTNMPQYERWKYGNRPMRGISDVIQWMDSELKKEGMKGIYITNKNSLLYKENKIGYKGIIDE